MLDNKKQNLRSKFLELRNKYSSFQLAIYNQVIFKKLVEYLNLTPSIKTIAFYWAINNEVDLKKFYFYCQKLNKKCLLPFSFQDKNLSLVFMFKKIEYNLFQHKREVINSKKIIDINQNNEEKTIDLIICPLVAYNQQNYRIGYGFGCYDKVLQKLKNMNQKLKVIGVGYNFQFTDYNFQTDHDFKLDLIITN